MSDNHKQIQTFVILSIPNGPTERYTSNWTPAILDGETCSVQGSLEVKPSKIESGIGSTECVIDGLQATTESLIGIVSHVPYAAINVEVLYAEVDPLTNIASNKVFIYKGTVYQAKPKVFSTYLALECREGKFFSDVVAGISCTEQCYAPYFGDPKICQKSVTEVLVTVATASGNELTVSDTLTDVDLSFNKGYFELAGVVIGIKYWKNGSTFLTTSPAPASWVGQQVSVFYGCDRGKNTCKNLHNNQSRFLGAGFGMMDYDPKYSTA